MAEEPETLAVKLYNLGAEKGYRSAGAERLNIEMQVPKGRKVLELKKPRYSVLGLATTRQANEAPVARINLI